MIFCSASLIYTVCQRSRGRLVDDTQHFEACDLTRVLGCLALESEK